MATTSQDTSSYQSSEDWGEMIQDVALGNLNIAPLVGLNAGDLRELTTQAWACYKRKDYTKAQPLYEALAVVAPDCPLIWLGLGYVRRALGEDAAAIDAFGEVVALEPQLQEHQNLLRDALFARASLYAKLSELDEAVRDLQWVSRLADGEGPEIAESQDAALELLESYQQQREAAACSWEELVARAEKDPKFVDGVRRLVRGEISFSQMTGIGDEELLEMSEMGMELFKGGKFKRAKKVFEGLTALDGQIPLFHIQLGLTEERLNNRQAAYQSYSACIVLEAGYKRTEIPAEIFEAHYHRGRILAEVKEYIPAARDFEAAMKKPEALQPAQRESALKYLQLIGSRAA